MPLRLRAQAGGIVIALLAALGVLHAQPAAPQAPASPKAASPIDLTGYWVSLVTEDWRYRMVTPQKGDYASVPLNPAARRAADAWDPAKDEAAGNQCKAYGAPAIMRVPGRLRITWQDDNTLKIETDAGTQTRLLHFGDAQPPAGDAGWQGYSAATWEYAGGGGRGRGAQPPRGGSLKVVTTHARPGYLRKNGIPYSDKAVLTEYFDRVTEPDGRTYLIVESTLEDPVYLNGPFLTSTHFKLEPDGSKWSPSPCSAK
jgi:hypothetical protein